MINFYGSSERLATMTGFVLAKGTHSDGIYQFRSVADLGFWKEGAIFSKVGAMIGKNHFLRTF